MPGTPGHTRFETVFKKRELRDVLDAMTNVFHALLAKGAESYGRRWLAFVTRVLYEGRTSSQSMRTAWFITT